MLLTSETLFLLPIHNFLTYILYFERSITEIHLIWLFFFCLLSLILMLLKNLKSQLMKSTFIFQAQMGSFLHDVVAVRKTFPEPPKENPAAADAKKERRKIRFALNSQFGDENGNLGHQPQQQPLNSVVWTRSAAAVVVFLWKAALFESEFAARYLFVWAACSSAASAAAAAAAITSAAEKKKILLSQFRLCSSMSSLNPFVSTAFFYKRLKK